MEGGREGDARGRRYGDICICITDSLCYKAETNNNKKRIMELIGKFIGFVVCLADFLYTD